MQPFKPQITRIPLNPEQAVLQCDCYNMGWVADPFSPPESPLQEVCIGPKSANDEFTEIISDSSLS